MRVLIAGITGQDGAYLARQLLARGDEVIGTTRDAASADRSRLHALSIDDKVKVVSMLPQDYRSTLRVIADVRPQHVYFLAGQTSVGLSFDQPVEAIESIATGVLNILEAIRFLDPSIRLFNAGSSECFGDTGRVPATEATPFRPLSPYAVAKATAHNLVANYRIAYSLFACTGILFNHESPLRPTRFVTQKIVHGARDVASGKLERLSLGNLDVSRDWGWAPDYVDAMIRMLNSQTPEDFVIATGHTVSLSHFVERAFKFFGLDWRRYVSSDPSLKRPSDISYGAADPSAIAARLGWTATLNVDAVIDEMCKIAALQSTAK
jgi:GDPmannose 4,6-dehydratase